MQKLFVLSCAFASICILVAYQTGSVRAAEKAAPIHRDFEYATLSRTGSNASWYCPGDNRAPIKAFDLYRDLGGKENESSFDNSELLSQIGDQGWELVTVVSDGPSSTFYFKRPA